MFHGKVGSRSSPGAAIACSDESSPQISFNVHRPVARRRSTTTRAASGSKAIPCRRSITTGSSATLRATTAAASTSWEICITTKRAFAMICRPTGPVAIEDNIIAGNNCTRGGPGGVRASRWGRVDLRRNCIVGNGKGAAHGAEGGVICVMENNIIADNGAKRELAKPKFRLATDIIGRNFDALHYATEFTVNASLGKQDLSGSVVRIGKQWSVVKSNTPNGLVVWGKVTDDAAKLELLDDYLTTK